MYKAANYPHECTECVHCQFPAHALIFCPQDNQFHPREWGIFCDAFKPALEIIAPATIPADHLGII